MKSLLILALVASTLAAFCINGNMRKASTIGNNVISKPITIESSNESYVSIIRNGELLTINIGEIIVGDKVQSYQYQYTEVLSVEKVNIYPSIITYGKNTKHNIVFTNSTALYADVGKFSELKHNDVTCVNYCLHNPTTCDTYKNSINIKVENSCDCLLDYESDFYNFVIKNNLVGKNILSTNFIGKFHELSIQYCDAIEVITENGHILVNNILFKTEKLQTINKKHNIELINELLVAEVNNLRTENEKLKSKLQQIANLL